MPPALDAVVPELPMPPVPPAVAPERKRPDWDEFVDVWSTVNPRLSLVMFLQKYTILWPFAGKAGDVKTLADISSIRESLFQITTPEKY